MRKELKQKLERYQRRNRREIVKELSDNWIEIMDQANLFKPEYKEIAEKVDRLKTKDFFQLFKNNGYHFKRDRSLKGKKYIDLNHFVSEIKMATRIQREGTIESIYYFGIHFYQSARRGEYYHPEFAHSIDLNDEDIKRDNQHCTKCYVDAIMGIQKKQ